MSKIRHRFRKGSDLEIDILYPPLENLTTRTTKMLQKHEWVLGSIRERKLLKELTGFLQTLIHKRAVETFVGSKKIYFLGKLGLLWRLM